jgi:hypothetical protein
MAATGHHGAGSGSAAVPIERRRPASDVSDRPYARPGTVKQNLAAETRRLYAGDWGRFQRFCADRGETVLPASPALVAAFLASSRCGKAALSRRLAAIDHQHRQRGVPAPGADPRLRAALRQARAAAPGRQRTAASTPAALQRMAGSCRGDLTGQRDRAVLLLLASSFGRATIVALQAEQLRFSEPGVTLGPVGVEGALVRLARSSVVACCPVRALEEWLQNSGTRYGPVFRKINRWGRLEHAALGADAIRLILARRGDAAPPREGR